MRFLLLFFTNFLVAQSFTAPVKLSFGFNAIDAYPTNSQNIYDTGKLFEDFFATEKHWNFSGVPLYLQGSYYINKKTAISLGGTFNAISKLGNTITQKSYFSIDTSIDYSFFEKKIDPYFSIGIGGHFLRGHSSVTLDLGGGINFWIRKSLAFNISTKYKHTRKINGIPHFQHTVGISIK